MNSKSRSLLRAAFLFWEFLGERFRGTRANDGFLAFGGVGEG